MWHWQCTISLAFAFAAQSFAGTVNVNGTDIEYRWRDGETIWYPPQVSRQVKKVESYNLCNERFASDPKWQVIAAGSCTIQPAETESWGQDFQSKYEEWKTNELYSELPPEKKTQVYQHRTKLFKQFEKNCPKGFTLDVQITESTKDQFLKSRKDPSYKAKEVPVCYNQLNPIGTCKPGFKSNEHPPKNCARVALEPCPDGATNEPDRQECLTCIHGGQIDMDPKHTDPFHYCKVQVGNVKAAGNAAADADSGRTD